MPKKIVFCADGTWNHPNDPVKVEDSDTNVYKLCKCLSYTATQFTAYDPGVGTGGNLLQHLTGGAFGDGLLQKIKDGYTAIAHVYEQDDSIYIFGFSRGAYTARSLAGMIAICGLPTKGFDQNLVDTAFQAYRARDGAQRQSLLKSLANYDLYDAKITCLGVWDTVGALGIPVDPLGLDNVKYGFLDTSLHPDVRNAFHAVSIDERRAEFPPTLWTGPFAQGQRVEQVWFAGVHCDVGGGYAETGLSDITLGWMLTNALSCEKPALELVDSLASSYLDIEAKHALDTIHESWNVIWGFPRSRAVPQNATLSNSVAIRVVHDGNYRPQNLQLAGNAPASNYATQPVIAAPALAVAAGQ